MENKTVPLFLAAKERMLDRIVRFGEVVVEGVQVHQKPIEVMAECS